MNAFWRERERERERERGRKEELEVCAEDGTLPCHMCGI
jgi:hypothetical protein